MIKSFANKKTEELFQGKFVKQFSAFREKAERKLTLIDSAHRLEDLMILPGNKLEALKGDRMEYYSIRVNNQWRVRFKWIKGNAYDVEIVDYH